MECIPLENEEFEGRNNVYLFTGEETVGLVDSGVATTAARDQLEQGLEAHGYGFGDIDDLVVTHWHPDHAGLAGAIQDAGGARVHTHRADADLVSHDEDTHERFTQLRRSCFDAWGIPEPDLTELISFFDAKDEIRDSSVAVTSFESDDRLTIGGQPMRVIHTPGHTVGLCCFDLLDGTLLSSDAVLPQYTPNIGGADPRVDAPLQTYLESLQTLLDEEFNRLHPGHRESITEPAARIREIISHHHDRAHRVLEVLETTGPATPWTVSAELFGDLSGIHIMHGPGEAFAHLDHLWRAGAIDRSDGLYQPPETAVDVDELLL